MLLWPFNKYPGTDYETFNWEWLISKWKKLEENLETIHNSMISAENSANSAMESASSAADSAGTAEEIENRMRDMEDRLLTGNTLFTQRLAAVGNETAIAGMTYYDNKLLYGITDTDNHLTIKALDLLTGAISTYQTINNLTVANDLTVKNGYLYIAAGTNGLYSIELGTSGNATSVNITIATVMGVTFFDGDMYVVNNSKPAKIYKIDADTLETLQSNQLVYQTANNSQTLAGGLDTVGDVMFAWFGRPNTGVMINPATLEVAGTHPVTSGDADIYEMEGSASNGDIIYTLHAFNNGTNKTGFINITNSYGGFDERPFLADPYNPTGTNANYYTVNTTTTSNLQNGTASRPFNKFIQAISAIAAKAKPYMIRLHSDNSAVTSPHLYGVSPMRIYNRNTTTPDYFQGTFAVDDSYIVFQNINFAANGDPFNIDARNSVCIFSGCKFDATVRLTRSIGLFENCDWESGDYYTATIRMGSMAIGAIEKEVDSGTGLKVEVDATSFWNLA